VSDDPAAAAATTDSLVALALIRSPRLAALAESIEAAREGAPAEGALPDPMIGVSARGEKYPGAGIGKDPMAEAAFEVSQAIPWPGKRGSRQAAAEAQVGIAEAQLVAARRRLAAEVRTAYAEQAMLGAAQLASRESLALIDVLMPSVAARYETGQAAQLDVVGLQLERSRLEADLDDLAARRAQQTAELAAALDLPISDLPALDAGLPAVDGAVVAAVAPAELAEVATAEARITAARRRAESAEREGSPDLILGAEYGWRDALPPMLTARVGVELPLWQGRKQDAMARAARREQAMAEADQRDVLAMAGAEFAGLQARYDAAERQVLRLRTGILPQATLAAESARAGYVTGTTDASDLIMALRQLAETRAMLAEREADRYTAWATLRVLAGRDPVLQENR
jgi:cobalt-zinc-cadmium efflux system outer membrane protein